MLVDGTMDTDLWFVHPPKCMVDRFVQVVTGSCSVSPDPTWSSSNGFVHHDFKHCQALISLTRKTSCMSASMRMELLAPGLRCTIANALTFNSGAPSSLILNSP